MSTVTANQGFHDATVTKPSHCAHCGGDGLLVALHGDRGGPDVCIRCSSELLSGARKRKKSVDGGPFGGACLRSMIFGMKSIASEDELDAETLEEALKLTHPDRHPPERFEAANRVSAALTALRPYVKPREQPEPERDDKAKSVTTDSLLAVTPPEPNEPNVPNVPGECGLCKYLPTIDLYCEDCRAVHERRIELQRKVNHALQTAETCWGCGATLDAVWRFKRRVDGYHRERRAYFQLPHCEKCFCAYREKPPKYEEAPQRASTAQPCDGCGRPLANTANGYWLTRKVHACSKRCAARALRALKRKPERPCDGCGQDFTPARSDSLYCSAGCRQRAYRQRQAER